MKMYTVSLQKIWVYLKMYTFYEKSNKNKGPINVYPNHLFFETFF